MLETETIEQPETEEVLREDDVLHCAGCRAPLTRERYAISKREDHEHTVFNPMGEVFVLRCFSNAQGAKAITRATHHFSWFPGNAWQIAVCRNCSRHIGWEYTGEDHFFGLIKGMLRK